MAAVVVKSTDMPEPMLNYCIERAETAMLTFNTDKEVAQALRNEFVKQYNGVWHCIVGHNFGAFTIYEQHHFVYFYKGQTAVLLFKTG